LAEEVRVCGPPSFDKFEKPIPTARPPRQDHIPSRVIAPDEHFVAFKAKIRREANSLTSAIAKELGATRHRSLLMIYTTIYISREEINIKNKK
jgi:hypothetical protein